MSFIEVKDLVKTYQSGDVTINALNNVSFSVEKGEFVVILGASGAGKSTLLNVLGGMDLCTSGTYKIGTKEVTNLKNKDLINFRRNDIGFVFQFYNLIPSLTALENVQLQSEACKYQPHMEPKEALNAVGLENRANNFPGQLSGGEQQRVSIARAIVKKPALLLCDEPTGALDSKTGKNILTLLKDLAKNEGFTVIIVTHNANIAKIADHIIRLNDGQIVSNEYNENPLNIEEIEW